MKTLFEHIEYVQGKPHHVRKRIAFGAAAGTTALIALVWFIGTLAAGTFAIHGSSFAESTRQGQIVATGTGNANQNNVAAVAAVAAASGGSSGNASAPAHIEIVNAASATSSAAQTDRTTIPF